MYDKTHIIKLEDYKSKHKKLTADQIRKLPNHRLKEVLKVARIDLKRAEAIGYCKCCDDYLADVHPRDFDKMDKKINVVVTEQKEYFNFVKEICDGREDFN